MESEAVEKRRFFPRENQVSTPKTGGKTTAIHDQPFRTGRHSARSVDSEDALTRRAITQHT
ncbi:hypothetical protein [Streptomyces capparidis]|jgi:hypothetical protein